LLTLAVGPRSPVKPRKDATMGPSELRQAQASRLKFCGISRITFRRFLPTITPPSEHQLAPTMRKPPPSPSHTPACIDPNTHHTWGQHIVASLARKNVWKRNQGDQEDSPPSRHLGVSTRLKKQASASAPGLHLRLFIPVGTRGSWSADRLLRALLAARCSLLLCGAISAAARRLVPAFH